jgi:hypothetical protein
MGGICHVGWVAQARYLVCQSHKGIAVAHLGRLLHVLPATSRSGQL